MKLLFERSRPGRGNDLLPPCDVPVTQFDPSLLRGAPLRLPEIAEVDLGRHYTELAKQTHGVNDGFYPLGSCTMKYNPKLGEETAALAARLAWHYPHGAEVELPSKLTATQLKGRALDEEAAEAAVRPPRPIRLGRPRFAAEEFGLTPAQKGTALHLVMQYIDFERTERVEQVRAEIARLVERAMGDYPGLRGQVIAVENDFFGHTIDVAGLLTGQDISAQLRGRDLGDRVLIPIHMMRHGETVFLDDYTVERLSRELGVPVQVVDEDGFALVDAMFAPE